jgi:subtilase family serine protease
VRADPDNQLVESNETNNDRYFRTYVNPAAAPVNDYLSLRRAPGSCAPLA